MPVSGATDGEEMWRQATNRPGTERGRPWRPRGKQTWYPRQESNLRLRLRRPTLYPLSYGGLSAW